MQFCTNCGKQVQIGNVCECKLTHQPDYPPPQPPQQPQYPNQQYPQNQQMPPPQYPQQGQYPPPQYPNPYGKQMKPAGQTMIKVVGILLVIFGAFELIGFDRTITLNEHTIESNNGIYVLTGLAMLACGIIGIVCHKKKDKAPLVVGCGIGLLVLLVVCTFAAMLPLRAEVERLSQASGTDLSGMFMVITVLGALINCILPLLFIIGGNKRKNAEF
jgi:hypothetical protein